MSSRAVDTNIVVRLIVRDDPAQVTAAEGLLPDGIFILSTVLLEAEWVLRSRYRLDAAAISDGFERLFGLAEVELENAQAVADAIAAYRAGAEFADALHVAQSASRPFATFDKRLAQRFSKAPAARVELLS